MSTLQDAQDYADAGWRVVPIKPGEKVPAVQAWQTAGTTDPAQVSTWWTRWPGHGIGIVTGVESGLFVLDVDTNDGKVGAETLAQLEAEHGPLPTTRECVTGSGGRHLYFRMPTGQVVTNSAGKLGPDLDVRGEGGYVVAPPTIHPTTGRPYQWELMSPVEPVDAPAWLLGLLEQAVAEPRQEREPHTGSERPGDRFAARYTWPQLLEADGATFIGKRVGLGSEYEMWARPGADHTSATLYYGGTDVLKVFTGNWPGLDADDTYTKFGFWTATQHGGDFSAATKALGDEERRLNPEPDVDWAAHILDVKTGPGPTGPDGEPVEPIPFLKWPVFWKTDHTEEAWTAWPLIPTGRAVALYAPAKAGKSTIVLDVVIAAATGRSILGATQPTEPVHVMYLDYEMTEADLQQRLIETGYDETVDLSHFHYALLPTIPPLDTQAGADLVLRAALSCGAEAVIIDTFSRAVEGEENDANTVNSFYRYTGLALKSAGIAYLRTDHSGKDIGKGQRGSSAKDGDVDVVWKLTKTEDGTQLTRTHSRISWVKETLSITKSVDPVTEVTSYVSGEKRGVPAGTKAKADEMDRIGVPLDATIAEAKALLKAAGCSTTSKTVGPALTARRDAALRAALTSDPDPDPEPEPDEDIF